MDPQSNERQSSKTGQCLCGAVSLRIHVVGNSIGACHCEMCRRWGGGPLLEVSGGTEISIEGVENVETFSSSHWAVRGFCKTCGTHLYYRVVETGEYTIPLGLLDDEEGLHFDHQVYIDEKPESYSFSNPTRMETRADMIEKYGGIMPK